MAVEEKILTEEEKIIIRYQLRNYKRVTGEDLGKISWPTFVKTMNKTKKKLNYGGVIIKNCYPDYFLLKNIGKKLVWGVRLEDNAIFIKKNIDLNNLPIPSFLIKKQSRKLILDGDSSENPKPEGKVISINIPTEIISLKMRKKQPIT